MINRRAHGLAAITLQRAGLDRTALTIQGTDSGSASPRSSLLPSSAIIPAYLRDGTNP